MTKLYIPGKVVRYRTPSILRRGLQHFDVTGTWNLPDGEYHLAAMPDHDAKGSRTKRTNSWKKSKPKGTGRTTFKARALPTRQISYLTEGARSK